MAKKITLLVLLSLISLPIISELDKAPTSASNSKAAYHISSEYETNPATYGDGIIDLDSY